MKRIQSIILLALCAVTATAFCQQKPNIVILYADDMGYGDLGANNPKSKIPTPHLDRLAASGMLLTDGHSSSGICSPSRYALLTGRAHWRDFHNIVDALGKPVFKEGQLTVAAMLREKGYATAAIGKWHLGWDWDAIRKTDGEKNRQQFELFDWSKPVPGGPLDRGFDYYFGDEVINFPPYGWIENNKLVKAPDTMMDTSKWKAIKEGQWECRPGPMVTGWNPYDNLPTLTHKSVDYVMSRKGKEQPFFLYIPFPSPHAPIIPTDEFDGKSQAGAYGDYVNQTDDACGRILKAIDDIGQTANTIVFFSADNGPESYATVRKEKFDHWSSEPLRGLKRHIHEGGHRVPTIMRWPGVIKEGVKSDALFAQTDLMATFAALVGYELPANSAEDSFNFLPYLRGESDKGPRTAMVHNTNAGVYAIREGGWVLVNVSPTVSSSPEEPGKTGKTNKKPGGKPKASAELYNLKEDIGQKENLISQHPERAEALHKLLDKLHSQGHSAPRLE
jgi:arylsulfatase A